MGDTLPSNKEIKKMLKARTELMLRNAHLHLLHKYKKKPLWSFVRDITGFGSTYSTCVCYLFGWDPHQDAGKNIVTTTMQTSKLKVKRKQCQRKKLE